MKKAAFISVITVLHALVSWTLFFISFGMIGMRGFDDGTAPGFVEKFIFLISKLLLSPIFFPLIEWGPRWLTGFFHGLLGYIPILLNSFVWGIAAWWLYSRTKKSVPPTRDTTS